MDRFALKVDLSDVLKDVQHQKVMILVDPQWQNVAEVENKIKKMFNITKCIGFKSAEGFFIPLEEPVEILRYVNMVIAFKVKQQKETISDEAQSKNTNLPIEPEIVTTAEFASRKKRKLGFLNEENFTTSTPNVAKRLKSISPGALEELSPVSDTLNLAEKRSKKKSKTVSPNKALQEFNGRTSADVSKTKTKSFEVQDENMNSKPESHIFFESNTKVEDNSQLEKHEEEQEKSKIEIVFLCELTDSEPNGRGRNFEIGRHQKANNTDQQITIENHQSRDSKMENSTLVKEVNLSLTNANSNTTIDSTENQQFSLQQSTKATNSLSCSASVIDLNETEKTSSKNESNLSQQHETDSSINNDSYASKPNESSFRDGEEKSIKAVPLKDLPNLNDQLIFKIMLSNNKLSDNFLGKCEYINRRTKAIKIHLSDGHSQIRYLPQKYAGNIDDSNGITILNVKLQEMIDPKVLQD